MHTNVAISSDKNTVNDTCLTTFQILTDPVLPEIRRQGGQLRRPGYAWFQPAGWPATGSSPPPSPQDTSGSGRNGFMGLSRVPEHRCGVAAARDPTGWEHVDGAALKGGNRRQLQHISQPAVPVAD
jgi:hypothetical protein